MLLNYLTWTSRNFVHNDLIGWSLQSSSTEHLHQSIDDRAHSRRTINMHVARTWIPPRKCSRLKKWDDIRDVIGMEMRKDNVLKLGMLHTNLQQPLHYSVPAIKEDMRTIQL
jgi:hypothetical protein